MIKLIDMKEWSIGLIPIHFSRRTSREYLLNYNATYCDPENITVIFFLSKFPLRIHSGFKLQWSNYNTFLAPTIFDNFIPVYKNSYYVYITIYYSLHV